MAFIIPRFSYGDELGKGIGTGVSQVAQSLLENKLQQLNAQRGQERAYQAGLSLFGNDEKRARAYSMLDPKAQQNIGARLFLGMEDEELTSNFNPPPIQPNKIEQLQQSFAPQKTQQQQLLEDLGILPRQQLSQFGQQPAQMMPQQEQIQPAEQQNQTRPISNKEKFQKAYARGEEILDPRLGIEREKLALKKSEAITERERKELEHFDKKYQSFNEDLTKKGLGAEQALQSLGAQEVQLKHGKLSKPSYVATLKTLGIDFPFLFEGDSVALDKEGIKLAQASVQDTFGNRPTNFGFEKTLETTPNSLHNPKDALDLVYRGIAAKTALKARYDARNQILEENKGYSPANLNKMIDDRVKKELDSLSLAYNYALPPASSQKPGTEIESYGFRFNNDENRNYWKRTGK